MTAKAAFVLLIIAILALVLAVATVFIHMVSKPDPRYWAQVSVERERGGVFFWCLFTSVVCGTAAWVVWP